MPPTTPALSLGLGPGPNQAPIHTVAPANTTADRALAPDPVIDDLAAGPTAESVDAGATVTHPCPTAAGTSATVLIQIQTAAWECLD